MKELLKKSELMEMNQEELSVYIDSLTNEEIKALIKQFSDEELSEFIDKLDDDSQVIIFNNIEESKGLDIINDMDFNDAVSVINEFEEEQRDRYLKNFDKEKLNKLIELKEKHLSMHPKDVAFKLQDLDDEEREEFFDLFTASELAEFFSYLDSEDAKEYITSLSDNKASDILEEMDVDDAVDVINELDKDDKESYLELMDKDTKEELETLANYDEDEAASIMDTSYLEVDGNKDVKDAMKILVKNAPDVNLISTIFVSVDNKFYGTLDFRKLIVTKSPCLVKDITQTETKTVNLHDRIEEVINMTDDYDIYALPVLDDEKLVGIITIDDVLDRMKEEKEEDYNQLAGMSGDTDVNISVMSRIKNRLPWLLILCILDLFVCVVISSFENVISSMTLLVLFEPIVLGIAGNVGTQSLAVCVRSISYNELKTKKAKAKHILKEFRNGLMIGIIISVMVFFVSYLYIRFIAKTPNIDIIKVSLIISVSILLAITFSCLFGCLVPIIFDSLHIDPAAASGPFITTLNDILAIVIYFSLASIFLL